MKILLGRGKCTMGQLADYSSGELKGDADQSFLYVCTDSREADGETLFVATRGERVDGHDYITAAIGGGCRCILSERIPEGVDLSEVAFVRVPDSIESFAALAEGYRADLPIETLAITGSYGKTTTKELSAAILQRNFKNYSTSGNFNSVIGMPMSLLEAPEDMESAVFEMGMSSFGEISAMSRVARPRVAAITNVGSSHLEYLKTRENIARAKLEIADGIRDGGYLLLNGDEELLRAHRSDGRYKIIYFGMGRENDIYPENVRISESGTSFDMIMQERRIPSLRISLVGKHFVYNAMIAAGAALILGASELDVREGLASYRAAAMRSSIEHRGGVKLLADCYNAAPESMRAAIDTLCSLEVTGKRIAVLGDMRELGDGSAELHKELGRYAADKLDVLICIGPLGSRIAREAERCGGRCRVAFCCEDTESVAEISEAVRRELCRGDAILFKASRSLKLERVIEEVFG